MTRQAIGVPEDANGPHAYFNQFNIDAISIDVGRESTQGQYESGGGSVVSARAIAESISKKLKI